MGQQGRQGQQSSAIINLVQSMLAQNGGVQGLIQRFSDAGFSDHAQSWVQGDRVPMTSNQIDQVFSPDEISGWATQLGVDPEKMPVVLAEAMPHVVDHLTPNGQVLPEKPQTFPAWSSAFLGQRPSQLDFYAHEKWRTLVPRSCCARLEGEIFLRRHGADKLDEQTERMVALNQTTEVT